jgi:iron-sulfur cluster assembly accessory protein
VRIALKPGGCAGFEYKFDYIDDLSEPDDLVMDFVTFKVAIDRMSLPMLDGATLDWTVNGINEEFIFRNPNEQSKCGCGVSAIF